MTWNTWHGDPPCPVVPPAPAPLYFKSFVVNRPRLRLDFSIAIPNWIAERNRRLAIRERKLWAASIKQRILDAPDPL